MRKEPGWDDDGEPASEHGSKRVIITAGVLVVIIALLAVWLVN